MNITLTGNLGAGKTSVCKELEKMGYQILSTGAIFRKIAEEKGISVLELNELAKKDRSIDDMIDNRTIELGKKVNNTIFDSRLAWNFIPDSFKVFLYIDTDEAAKRVISGENREAESYTSFEDAKTSLYMRARLEQARFKDLYDIDYYNAANYNLVIETTSATPEEIAKEIARNFEAYQQKAFQGTKIELNISSIYPTQNFRDFNNETFMEYLQKENNNQTDCALDTAPVTLKDGFYYLLDAHHRTYAAANAGKKFVAVNIFTDDKSRNTVPYINKTELYDFEDIGKFRYKKYPNESKSGYNLNVADIAIHTKNQNRIIDENTLEL